MIQFNIMFRIGEERREKGKESGIGKSSQGIGVKFCVDSFRAGGEWIDAEGSHHKALAWPREHKG